MDCQTLRYLISYNPVIGVATSCAPLYASGITALLDEGKWNEKRSKKKYTVEKLVK